MNGAELLAQTEAWHRALAARGLVDPAVDAALAAILDQSRGERLDLPIDPLLVVMLCGPTMVGKSSLINALAGAEISRPGLGATTGAPVLYVHVRDDPQRLFEYSEALGQLAREPASLVRHARDELLHKVLVDTPDIDSVMLQHRDLTEALVHAADLLLFVTSPEKYKNRQSLHWVAEHRAERAMAFVLNKWDRAAFGLQYDERQAPEREFRAMLAAEGFADPLVFKTSALPVSLTGAADSDLPALDAWLGAGLDRAAATAIQDLRRRAAWGRLGATIAAAVPQPLSGHPFLKEVETGLARAEDQARHLVATDAVILVPHGLDRRIRPTTFGLLGSWLRLTGRIGALGGLLTRRPAGPSAPPPGFGRSAAAQLGATTAGLATRAQTMRLPLGPVGADWAEQALLLAHRLDALPAEREAALIEAATGWSLRRVAGWAALLTVEAALSAVLALALWRIGMGFVRADYETGAVLGNASALVVGLLLLGQIAANGFFPDRHDQLRRMVTQGGRDAIGQAWKQCRILLAEQVQASDRLARDGRALLAGVDRMVLSLAPAAVPSGTVPRLFSADGTKDRPGPKFD